MNVAYIAGAPRSGTTILALALAERPGYVTVGELSFLWEKGVIGNQLCGCGRPFHECSFWVAVGQTAFGGWQNVDAHAMVALRKMVDRARFVPLAVAPWLAPRFRHRITQYIDVLERVYEAVGTVTGCNTVIDSSKTPTCGLMLRYLRRTSPVVIHVTRDSRGVAYSWSKRQIRRPEFGDELRYMNTFGACRTSALWVWHNLPLHACRFLRLRRTPVRYEDLVRFPSVELNRVSRSLGVAETGGSNARRRIELGTHHTVSGNRVRFSTHLDLHPDEEWRIQLPPRSRITVTLLTAPLLLAYGYIGGRVPRDGSTV